MGIVLNQSFKNMATTYFGFGIGAVNVLFLYPNFLQPEYYGLVTFLLSAGSLVWPAIAFGANNTLVKFYSSYKIKQSRDKLLSIILIFPFFFALFLGTIGLVFYEFILETFNWNNGLEEPYIWLIYVIAFAMAYFEVFFAWSKVQLKSVFGNFMREVFHRICVTVLLLLVFFDLVSVPVFLYSLAGIYLLRMLIMGFYAFKMYLPKLEFRFPTNKTEIFKYTFLMFVAGSVAVAMLELDMVMIEFFMPIENVSIYAVGIYIASVIAVPFRAMQQITNPMTASLLNKRDRPGLEDLYKRSSITLLVVGGLVFLLIVGNVNQLYRLLPEVYQIGVQVAVLVAIAKLYDNLLGNANGILFYSDFYRLVLLLGVLLAGFAFALYVFLIPAYGIYGAAYATFIAFFAFNTLRLVVIYGKLKLQPFTKKTGIVLLIIGLMGVGFYFWDFQFHPLVNIVLKSILICAVYVALIFWFDASKDISILIRKFFRRGR